MAFAAKDMIILHAVARNQASMDDHSDELQSAKQLERRSHWVVWVKERGEQWQACGREGMPIREQTAARAERRNDVCGGKKATEPDARCRCCDWCSPCCAAGGGGLLL